MGPAHYDVKMQIFLLYALLAGCDDEILDLSPPPQEGVHPAGYADPSEHGHEAKFQDLECAECHGADLSGGDAGISCDSCHSEGWRQDCTFCHGDPEEGSGSPPVHISGTDDGAEASFIPHRTHTSATEIKGAFECSTCHTTPTDVLSVGHLFVSDTTPGRAEVSFLDGLSPAADWDGNGGCSNLYCHGNGRGNNGEIDHEDSIDNCHECHGDWTNENLWDDMSGAHEDHLEENLDCSECHSLTVDDQHAIIDITKHVNGIKDVELPYGMTRANGECTGTCHNEQHNGRDWD